MEIISTKDAYLVIDGEHALHCSKVTGQITAKHSSIVCEAEDPKCVGKIAGVIGRLPAEASGDRDYLLVIAQRSLVAHYPITNDAIYRIDRVVALPLALDASPNWTLCNFETCSKHQGSTDGHGDGFSLLSSQKKFVRNSLRFVSDRVQKVSKPSSSGNSVPPSALPNAGQPKLLDEIVRLFNDQGDFYLCPTGNLTLSLQRFLSNKENNNRFDRRFFWNRPLLKDLCGSDGSPLDALAKPWVVPVVQGFVASRSVRLDMGEQALTVTLISRRSVDRAGMRYIKRGIDEGGNVANYVETEQILGVFGHCLSFVQIRGSVPVFWNQRGYRYRPALQIDRPLRESMPAFELHMNEQLSIYNAPVAVVNLVDQAGRELKLGESFLEHVLLYNSPQVAYFAFDFHNHCRAMRFDKISTLLSAVADKAAEIRFCWADKHAALVCEQRGVFRVNCVDCLDRTNVVQMALALATLEKQLVKLGLVSPLANDEMAALPGPLLSALQHLWADNGDSISKQYAGTAALKGDMTRSGQRGLTGMMRDGYNSASRYYLCHMRDAIRQDAVDALLGQAVRSLEQRQADESQEDDETEVHEDLRRLVHDCQRFFLPEGETLLGGWALVDADPATGRNDFDQVDMDRIVLLTREAVHVAEYDDQLDKFADCQRIPLENLTLLEVGPMSRGGVALSSSSRQRRTCLRVHYIPDDCDKTLPSATGFFFTWRTASTRLFNNMAIPLKNNEEADEYVRAIAEQFRVATDLSGFVIPVTHLSKMERHRSHQMGQTAKRGFSGLFSGAGGAVKARLTGFVRRGKHTPHATDGPVKHAAPSSNRRCKVAVSSAAGLLFHNSANGVFDASDISSKRTPNIVFLDDMAIKVPSSDVHKPADSSIPSLLVQCVDSASNSHTPNTDSPMDTPGRDGAHSSLGLTTTQLGESVVSLRPEDTDHSLGDDLRGAMKTSKSDGMIVAMDGGGRGRGRMNRLQDKLRGGIDITVSSLAKVSSHVQQLGSSAHRIASFRTGAASNHSQTPPRSIAFESFSDEISKCQSLVVLL